MATNAATPKPSSQLTVGSEWAKWELHIHSPASALNNQFPSVGNKPDWDAYVTALEQLNGFAAIGITDYFSIEGYQEILKWRGKGRISNVPLVLPNIELRLDTLVPTKHGDKRINLHVIFSEMVPIDDIEERFLRQVFFTYVGSPQAPNERWSITRKNLEQLGKKLKEQQPTFVGSDYEVGCMNAAVNLNEVKDVLDNSPTVFKGKFLLVLAAQYTDDISWEGQGHQTRKVLIQGADAVFSSNQKTRDWMLGKLDLTPEQFRSEFIVLKPCVHGSDAHEIAKIGKPDEDRFCWIKATPTFEGLRQILFEPEARVYIGDNAPVVKNDYQVIRSFRVAGAFSWFSEQEIPINRDLVSIIGGRGTGKSALAELIAFAGGADTFRAPRERDIQDTFLFKASKKSPQNPQPVTGAELTLTWRDNQKSVVKITDGLNHGLTEPKVKYLAQRFVETLCAPENTSQIEREIERVIFNRTPVTRRYGASNFQELRETATKANQVKKRRVTAAIEDLNKLIYDSFVKVGSKAEKQQGLRQTQGGLQSLLKQTPELPPQNKNDIEQLEKLDLLRKQLEGMIVGLREQQNAIDTLEARFHAFEDEIRTFNEETRALVEAAGLSERLPEFLATAPPNALRYIDQRRSELSNQIRIITEGPTAPGGPTLQAVIGEIEAVRQRLQLSDVKRNEYDKFHKDKQTLESAIASLSREIAEIDTTV
jgi:hypothetical protein